MSSEISDLSPLARAALDYADRGWAVHPIWHNGHVDRDGNPADKTPATKRGFKDATCDKLRIRTRWLSTPDSNIGIACGASGLVTIDYDMKNGINGRQALRAALGHDLPPTLVVITPSGGEHWYYFADQWIEVKSCSGLYPNVDIRAIDGYVVAPPSVVGGKPYTWQDESVMIQPVPWEILAAMQKGVSVGGRDDFLAKVLGPRLRNKISDGEQMLDEMLKANERYFGFGRHPDGPLSDGEVRKIAASIMRNMGGQDDLLHATDQENGRRMYRVRQSDLRWVEQRKHWFFWNRQRWTQDLDGAVSGRWAWEAADELAEMLKEEMAAESRRALLRHLTYSKSVRGWKNTLEALKTFEGIGAAATQFDSNPWLLGVQNGVIDLKSGTHREGIREDLMTKSCAVEYDAAAQCPRFEKFITEVCVYEDGTPDPRLVDWWWRFLGYALTGLTTEQMFVFAWGDGRNGKSTLIETMASMLGDYAQTIPVTVLMEGARQSAQGNTPEFAKLIGARLVQCNETRPGAAFATSDIKNLTGSDRICAQAKFEHPITFDPQFKLVIRGNNRPTFGAMDEGFKRRLYAAPFHAHFPPDSPTFDPYLPARLADELPGILNWCIRGCIEWQRRPLTTDVPAGMQELRAEWISEQVTFDDFIRDCCQLELDAIRERKNAPQVDAPGHIRAGGARGTESMNDEFYVEPKVLYDTYCAWSRNQPGMRMSTKAFSQTMRTYGHGVQYVEQKWLKGEGRAARAYTGIRLLPQNLSRGDF